MWVLCWPTMKIWYLTKSQVWKGWEGWETKDRAASCHVYSLIPSLKDVWNSYCVRCCARCWGKNWEQDKISVLFKRLAPCFSNIESNFITYSEPDLQIHRHSSSRIPGSIGLAPPNMLPTCAWNIYQNIDISALLYHTSTLKIKKAYLRKIIQATN